VGLVGTVGVELGVLQRALLDMGLDGLVTDLPNCIQALAAISQPIRKPHNFHEFRGGAVKIRGRLTLI
jgi:hypothetical protein